MKKLTMILSFLFSAVLIAYTPLIPIPPVEKIDEITSKLCAFVTIQKHAGGDITTKKALIGVEHRYEREQGINTRLHLSAMKESEKTHYHFYVEGHYKFQSERQVAVYPLVGLSWSRFSVTAEEWMDSKYLAKNMIHVGLGIEKSYYKFLVLGVKGHIAQEIDARTYEEANGMFRGEKLPKSIEWRLTGYFHLSIMDKGIVEIEPFYGKCFSGKYSDHGAKIGYSWLF